MNLVTRGVDYDYWHDAEFFAVVKMTVYRELWEQAKIRREVQRELWQEKM